MPWLTILMMLISYFASSRDTPEQRRKAALTAAVVGGATYYATHETDWGRDNLGQFDGVAQPTRLPDGTIDPKAVAATGNPATSATKPPAGTSGWDVLTSWGAGGTAAVVGGGIVAAKTDWSKLMPWALGLGGLFLLTR